ncbi:MAG: flagellin [Eubacteriales bacterium]
MGADYNRLERCFQAVSVAHEEATSANSLIRDTDVAEEMMKMVKEQILLQAQQNLLPKAFDQKEQLLTMIHR